MTTQVKFEVLVTVQADKSTNFERVVRDALLNTQVNHDVTIAYGAKIDIVQVTNDIGQVFVFEPPVKTPHKVFVEIKGEDIYVAQDHPDIEVMIYDHEVGEANVSVASVMSPEQFEEEVNEIIKLK